jgi:hypothetical protein
MNKALTGAVIGAVLGAVLGFLAGQPRLGDTSAIGQAGAGLCATLGAGLAAVAGALVGAAGAITDALRRDRTA